MFEIVLIVLSGVYLIAMASVAIAASLRVPASTEKFEPTVSVIIAARNEEMNIKDCLDTMINLTYPADKLQIIVVDDGSSDSTAEIVEKYVRRCPNVKLINALESRSHLKGKANAVAQGVDRSNGEILLFTDADCTIPREWVQNILKYFTTPQIGIVAGYTLLRGDTAFARVQALDWLCLFTLAAGTLRMGFPVTAVGNNLAIRRSAYMMIGGFQRIPFSVTEDHALFNAITSSTDYKAVFPCDRNTLVVSRPCASLLDLTRQKHRWFLGGREMDARRLGIFALAYVFHIGLVVGIFAVSWKVLATAFGVKLIADAILALPAVSEFGRKDLFGVLLLFEVFYLAYVILFPPLVAFGGSVVWKGRTLQKETPSRMEKALE